MTRNWKLAFRSVSGLIAIMAAMFLANSSEAQVLLNIPTVNSFNVRTTVMVPDGGQMLLGGVNLGSRGSVTRGVPGLAGVPGLGRAFRNKGIGLENSSSKSSVTATVISTQEMEEQIMGQAEKLARERAAKNPSLRPKIVRKANFITRNVGRSKKKR